MVWTCGKNGREKKTQTNNGGRTEGRRRRGRPRIAYMDKIEDIARKTGKRVGETKRMARKENLNKEWRQKRKEEEGKADRGKGIGT